MATSNSKLIRIIVVAILMVCMLSVNLITGIAEEQVTITYAYWGIPEEVEAQEKIIAAFHAQNDHIRIESEYVSSAAEFPTTLLTRIAGGNAPDVFYAGEAWVQPYASKGVLLDLLPIAQEDGFSFDDFWPGVLDPIGYNEGHVWAMPKDCTPMMVYYNKGLFDKAGVPYPTADWTFEEYRETLKKLTIVDESGRTVQYGGAGDNGWPTWFGFTYKNDGTFMDMDKMQVIEDQNLIDALQSYIDIGVVDKSMPSPSDLEGLGQGTLDLFRSGLAATTIAGRWNAFFLTDFEGEYGVVPLPNSKSSKSPLLFVTLVAPNNTKHPKEVWEFLKFYCSEAGITLNTNLGLGMPPVKSLTEQGVWMLEGEDPANKQIFMDQLADTRTLPFNPFWGTVVDDIYNRHLQDAARGAISVADAVKLIAEEGNAAIAAG